MQSLDEPSQSTSDSRMDIRPPSTPIKSYIGEIAEPVTFRL